MTEKITSKKPLNPRLVLLCAIFPGCGHLALGVPQRGLIFIFFIVVLAWVSLHLMPETASFFARHVGGIFVYGISILDAYKIARIRFQKSKFVT